MPQPVSKSYYQELNLVDPSEVPLWEQGSLHESCSVQWLELDWLSHLNQLHIINCQFIGSSYTVLILF